MHQFSWTYNAKILKILVRIKFRLHQILSFSLHQIKYKYCFNFKKPIFLPNSLRGFKKNYSEVDILLIPFNYKHYHDLIILLLGNL